MSLWRRCRRSEFFFLRKWERQVQGWGDTRVMGKPILWREWLRGLKCHVQDWKVPGLYSTKCFFSFWVFFHEHLQFIGQQGKGEYISLIPPYHSTHFSDTQTLGRRLLQTAHLCTQLAAGLELETLISERKVRTTKLLAQAGGLILITRFTVTVRSKQKYENDKCQVSQGIPYKIDLSFCLTLLFDFDG